MITGSKIIKSIIQGVENSRSIPKQNDDRKIRLNNAREDKTK